jgi:hypothetical protein
MSSTTVRRKLQLRIHERLTVTPSDGTVDFTLEHEDFLDALPPSWGGQVVRYAEGRTEGKPYEVNAVDTNGALTAFLGDNGRLAINGRLAELRLSTDGGAFERVDLRRITSVHGGSTPQYALELSDERWQENRTEIFAHNSSTQLHPPGVTSEWAGIRPAGHGTYRVAVVSTDYVALQVRSPSPLPPIVPPQMVDVLRGDLLDVPTDQGSFTSLRFEDASLTDRTIVAFNVDLPTIAAVGFAHLFREPWPLGSDLVNPKPEADGPGWGNVLVYWPSHGLGNNDVVTGRLHWANGVPTTPVTPCWAGPVR